MLAASSRLLLWVSDPKREGARLVGWVSPSGWFRCWNLCLLKQMMIKQNAGLGLSGYDALQRLGSGGEVRDLAWPAALYPFIIFPFL